MPSAEEPPELAPDPAVPGPLGSHQHPADPLVPDPLAPDPRQAPGSGPPLVALAGFEAIGDAEGLERRFLGERRYGLAEVCARAGVSVEEASRLWRAMGFADVDRSAPAFTDGDVAALRRVDDLRRRGLLDDKTALGITRAFGRMLGRLVEWQVEAFVEQESAEGLPPEVAAHEGVVAVAGVLPELEELLVYVWRRKLAAAANRTLSAADDDLTLRLLTVGFADLVGFTRLSRRLEEHELAEVVETFEARVSDIIAALGGRVIKTVGDEVLFSADRPGAGAEIALQIAETVGAHPLLPQVRVGLAAGTVLSRLGDVFGTTVNLASRLTSLAQPTTVLVDGAMAGALADDPDYEVTPLWRRRLRGLGVVDTGLLRRAPGR